MPHRGRPELSERERQVLELAAQGLTDTAIGHKLGISEPTVGTYWGRIRGKLGALSRTELVASMIHEQNEAKLDELRRENEELQRKLAEQYVPNIDWSGNVWKDLLEAAPDAILIVSDPGRIEHANPAVADIFGYSADELVGAPVSELVPTRFREMHREHMKGYFENPTKRQMGLEHMETVALHRDGHEFAISAALNVAHRPGGNWVVCIVRKLSDTAPELPSSTAARGGSVYRLRP